MLVDGGVYSSLLRAVIDGTLMGLVVPTVVLVQFFDIILLMSLEVVPNH